MADTLPPLPPGFTLDKRPTKENAAKLPPLPPGFTLNSPGHDAMNAKSEAAIKEAQKQSLYIGGEDFRLSKIIPGIWESIKSGVTLPGDVATGKIDPESPEAMMRMFDLTLMASPTSVAARAGEKAIAGAGKALLPAKPKIPTTQELKSAGGAGFDAARQMGVDYSADAVKSLADDLIWQLEKDGFRDATSPRTLGILRELQIPPTGGIGEGATVVASLADLIAARRTLQEIARAGGSEGEAARRAIARLDDFVVGADPASVVSGPAAAAASTVADARANYAASFRSKDIEKSITKAGQDADAANSGANLGNRIRQRLKSILQSDGKTRGYTPEEIGLLGEVVAGKHGANLARYVSNLLGGGGGLGQYVASGGAALAGAALGGPYAAGAAAALAPIAGIGLRSLSNKLTARQAENLAELLRMRSPLYEKAKQSAPAEVMDPEVRALLNRVLLLGIPRQGEPDIAR